MAAIQNGEAKNLSRLVNRHRRRDDGDGTASVLDSLPKETKLTMNEWVDAELALILQEHS
jgi:hypothetical protein